MYSDEKAKYQSQDLKLQEAYNKSKTDQMMVAQAEDKYIQ